MSEVLVCRDLHLDRDVIVKRLQGHTEPQRLIDEQKALLKLRSKHVVQLLDIVTTDAFGKEEKCLVMEYIDGADLSPGSFGADDKYVGSLWQIGSGIADIHQAGIIHRDIKPNNVRRDKMGVLKIFDFGLAREVGKDDATKNIIGTIGYMAPELFGTKTIPFSPAVDVYAFGATAVALLDKNLPDELKQGEQVPLLYLQKLMAGLHADVPAIIHQCTNSDPTKRPPMNAVRDTLEDQLLRDRHHARIVNGANIYELSSANRNISLQSAVGSIAIGYNGLQFRVTSVSGEVFVNNEAAKVDQRMYPACVITIGDRHRPNRAFLTFDVSHPEVMA
ncbi:serine/threonine protein kinase [Taklimakanibacter deserti]|uniref:serine/threonine protein kinase n=1 Tax=Taklimakanibacter deserti TaxID=2267839 RepID=UPI0013C43FF3